MYVSDTAGLNKASNDTGRAEQYGAGLTRIVTRPRLDLVLQVRGSNRGGNVRLLTFSNGLLLII